jgi:hypothetical protein
MGSAGLKGEKQGKKSQKRLVSWAVDKHRYF